MKHFCCFVAYTFPKKRLEELSRQTIIQNAFQIPVPSYADSIQFGLYALLKIYKEKRVSGCKLGAEGKKKKYAPYFNFVKNEYETLRKNKKKISDRYAASLIYPKLYDAFPNCPLTDYNGEETVRKWIAKIRKAN